jgi:hypothetical protein
VNRVFKDKPGGLVVDYIGIGENLRASLRAYDPELDLLPEQPLDVGVHQRVSYLGRRTTGLALSVRLRDPTAPVPLPRRTNSMRLRQAPSTSSACARSRRSEAQAATTSAQAACEARKRSFPCGSYEGR